MNKRRLSCVGARGQRLGQDPNRDVAVQFRIPRPIHLAHSSGAKRTEDFVSICEPIAWLHGGEPRQRCSVRSIRLHGAHSTGTYTSPDFPGATALYV